MSEAVIVRLVRCPKCHNLLPELAAYSVYQCGGCTAVLTATVKLNAGDSAEKSDQEKLGGYEKLGNLSGQEVEENVKSSSGNFVYESGSSNEDIGFDCVAVGSKENNGVKMDKYLNPRRVTNNESVANVDALLSANVRKLVKSVESIGNVRGSQGSEHMSRLRQESQEVSGHYGNVRNGHEDGRSLHLNYQEDGQSSYTQNSGVSIAKHGDDVNVFNMLRNNGYKDRAELLRMMEELSEQLRGSGNLGEKVEDKSPMNRNAAFQKCKKSSTSGFCNNNDAGSSDGIREGFMHDKPTISPNHDPLYFHRHPHGGRETNGVYNPRHSPHCLSNMPGYGNYSDMQTMRDTLQTPCPFEHQIPRPLYYQGHPFTDYPAICVPNSNNGLPHYSVCGFYNCCSDHHAATQPDYLDGTKFYDVNDNRMPYSPNIPGPSAYQVFSRKTSGLSSTFVDRSVQTRLADRDMRRYTHGYFNRWQEKGKLAKVGLRCQPIASGAPFVICQGCSKLLQLPMFTFKLNRKRKILCCGACNTVMVCAAINGKFTITVAGESKKNHLDDLTREENSSELCWAKMKSVTDDFYSSSHESRAMNGNFHVSPSGLDLTSNETLDSPSLPASSPASFEGLESLVNLASTSPNDLTRKEQLGNSFNANVTSRAWKGSQSTRSDHENVLPKDMISRQNSLNETSTTMEEVSFKVYSKTGVSQKSEPTTLRNDTEKTKSGSFAGVIKKSFKGLSRSNHSADSRDRNVTVNGCNVSERLVKRAEKLAGPIQSGNYWYDFRAGFWGGIGGPCLGIIPPCIEEFNYPMPANCSSGATGVFVNGRELQQIDLDLLASRGLPTARGGSYIIEISGKVVDKESGEELDGLGKLAPTIEKVKHGFGMKPRTQVVQ